jgi:hypothetical protein
MPANVSGSLCVALEIFEGGVHHVPETGSIQTRIGDRQTANGGYPGWTPRPSQSRQPIEQQRRTVFRGTQRPRRGHCTNAAQRFSTGHRGSSVLPNGRRGERGMSQELHAERGGVADSISAGTL